MKAFNIADQMLDNTEKKENKQAGLVQSTQAAVKQNKTRGNQRMVFGPAP